ncbi:MAG TPA: hypothetical protein VNN09_06985 [Candidatus Competibacteraceae bacterium]|nr:hypothetical protein [Candidatus Competibacteraceae bacterium]
MTRGEARFRALWRRCGGADAGRVYAELARRYAEPHRRYHTMRHIRRCLAEFDRARPWIAEPDLVELALWCHDVIYHPGAADNEQRSADWLRERAAGRIAAVERVATLILATTHCADPVDPAARYTVDIDLAGLGCDRAVFRRDGAALRAEQLTAGLAPAQCCRRERSFLAALLARPRIFHTEFFAARYEARARRNLTWRLAELERSSALP